LGSSGAILLPQGIGLLTAAFAERDISTAFGFYAPVLSLAAVSGPLVAGGLIHWDLWGTGWRLIFFVNLLLGAVAIGGGLRYLPADGQATLRRLDPYGMIIVAAATFLVIYPLIQGQQLGWPGWTFALLAAGIAVFLPVIVLAAIGTSVKAAFGNCRQTARSSAVMVSHPNLNM